jgi:bifunctional non-homologous end joining protein LigD
MSQPEADPTAAGVALTNLDQPLFDGSGATKRDLVGYMELMADRLIPHLRDRPLSVIRVRPGQAPFMQKNLPKYTPEWVASVTVWAQSAKREIRYALVEDLRTLVWFANQRAIEYHPTLMLTNRGDRQTHLVLDLDPPPTEDGAAGFQLAVRAARLVEQVLDDAGLSGTAKTSGAKGLHVFVPLAEEPTEDVAAATRAIAARAERLDGELATTAFVREDRHGKVFLDSTRAGGATVVCAFSPRIRPGVPVSFPVAWEDLESVTPADFTLSSVPRLLDGRDTWAHRMPPPQALPTDLVAEGHEIPIARVQAMHEGKRRARAARAD